MTYYKKMLKQRRLKKKADTFKKIMFWLGIATLTYLLYIAGVFFYRAIVLLVEIM